MRTSFRQTLIATTAILAFGAFAASAATPAPATATPAPAAASATPAPAVAHDHDMAGKTEQRITDLHAALNITTAQEQEWGALAAIMRDNASTMDKDFQARVNGMASMNAVDNMQSYAAMSMQHAENMQKLLPAFRTLYGVLTAEQKPVADQEFVDRANHGAEQPKG